MEIRLNKFLAERLGVSRREADELIAAGKITIDDKKAVLGDRISLPEGKEIDTLTPEDIDKLPKVCYNKSIVPFKAEYFYLAFNKPVGYVCSRRAQGEAPTIYELLPKKYHLLKTVGRLDKDSSGIILLTNDGDFAYEMTHPKFHKEKVYEVSINRPLEPLHQQMISDFGVLLEDGPSKFTVIKDKAQNSYIVVLSEGRNRQIRRTFAVLGYQVKTLHRTKFGPYELAALKPGEFEEFKKP